MMMSDGNRLGLMNSRAPLSCLFSYTCMVYLVLQVLPRVEDFYDLTSPSFCRTPLPSIGLCDSMSDENLNY